MIVVTIIVNYFGIYGNSNAIITSFTLNINYFVRRFRKIVSFSKYRIFNSGHTGQQRTAQQIEGLDKEMLREC